MPITWTTPFHHDINELALLREVMTFKKGSRISLFSTLFHCESKSIYEQNLLMGSNCTWFLCLVHSVTCRQPNTETKWFNLAGLNTCRCIISIRRETFAVMFRNQSTACGCPSLQNWSIVLSVVLPFFLICQWNLVDSIQTRPHAELVAKTRRCFNSFWQGNQRSRWSAVLNGRSL